MDPRVVFFDIAEAQKHFQIRTGGEEVGEGTEGGSGAKKRKKSSDTQNTGAPKFKA